MALSGLVSYGSSDESENENETAEAVVPESVVNGLGGGRKKNENNGDSLDEITKKKPVVGPVLPTLGLPEPKFTKNDDLSQDTSQTYNKDSIVRGLSALPTASLTGKTRMNNSDDEVEEELKKLPKNVQLPKPPKKSGKIKIVLPALPTAESDDEEPEAKKLKLQPASEKSGLIGMLPQPKHVAVKETNRALVPHTLTKKQPAPSRSTKPVTVVKLVDVDGSDSEDDGDDGRSFFTFAKKTEDSGPKPTVSVSAAPAVVARTAETDSASETPLTFKSTANAKLQSDQAGVSGYKQGFNPASTPIPEPSPHSMYGQEYSATTDTSPVSSYNSPAEYDSATIAGSSRTGAIDFETHQKLLQDEQFKRLVGKNFRAEEILDITDVDADDQMASHIEMTRSLTEEQSKVSYSKKRKDLPSQLSRRKHQITYLAFQAKEQEFELKNQWSQNKMTKRQTQAKYGF